MKQRIAVWRPLLQAFATLLAAPVGAAVYDADSLDAFFDGAIGTQIAEGSVVGATVAVVKDGRVVTTRGYGLADRERNVAVDPATTLFRIGSVSKLFVWVAVLQQEAAGNVALDADVNGYLGDLQIPATYPAPITLHHLMTHTPGFEDRVEGLFARGPRTVGTLSEELVRLEPKRVAMPGTYVAYSNYGAALAARVVERVAKEDWDDYVERRILAPLAMQHTTARQPVPKALEDGVATGYLSRGGGFAAQPFEYVRLPPIGAMSATANDMARFMIELLADRDTEVESAAAREHLFAPGFKSEPRLNGMLNGPYEQASHGQRIVGHDGDTITFHTALRLYPSQKMGVFMSFNSDLGARARGRVLDAFEDHAFGPPPAPTVKDRAPPAERVLGPYRMQRVPETGPTRLLALLATFYVNADQDGYLVAANQYGEVKRYVEIEHGLFESLDGRERVAFSANDGPAQNLYVDSVPYMGFVRVATRDTPLVQGAWLAASLLLLASAIWWPFSTLMHRGRIAKPGEASATLLGLITAGALIFFVVELALVVQDQNDVVFGFSAEFERALWIPVVAFPLCLGLLATTSRAWIGGYWWVSRRIHYTLVTIAAWAFLVWCDYWQMAALTVPLPA